MAQKPDLTIIHFNDVYDTTERKVEPVGGAPRFSSAIKSFKDENPCVLFSGDVFNPSIVSTVTKGKHMIAVLNILNVRASVYGNHDFDFGVFTLEKYAKQCNFPWVMSNVNDITTKQPLAGAVKSTIIEWKSNETTTVRIGIIGVVEQEWLATITGLTEQVDFLDPTEETRKLIPELKGKGADLIVVLSHMRLPNDEKLAMDVPEIDLILSGHDHFYELKNVNGVQIVKSGTDFRNFTVLRLWLDKDRKAKPKMEFQEVEITSKYPPDPEMASAVEAFTSLVQQKMSKVIGTVSVELDARGCNLRTRESNVGNFITDVIRNEFNCDVVLLNSGTIRSDATYGPGQFTMRDLLSILPFPDEIMEIEVTGEQLWEALENSVSKYPAHEGRFPQVSGIKFTFDPSKTPGERVISVDINGIPLQFDKTYTFATKTYIATQGADGYTMFNGCKVLVDAENAKLLPTLIRQHFQKLEVLNGMKRVDNLVRNVFKTKTPSNQGRTWKKAAFMVSPQLEGRINIVDPDALKHKYEVMTREELVQRCLDLERENQTLQAASLNYRHLIQSPQVGHNNHGHLTTSGGVPLH
eukprot:TRINITY_DN5489_c0_g1_i1.p1 TRINITY_DN5489_c0_g1~~TRINITY_DN5489_c0_g1_i1.p1  ORF type:complete len:581 (-),score=154.90 TRINITY_DN5489_c0_g1_i1:83-1825(-)